MAAFRALLLAMAIVASARSQIMFDSFPTSTPTQGDSDLTFQISNTTDAPLPNLGQLLMNLITLAKQLAVDTPDHQPPMPPPWNRPEMGMGHKQPGMGMDQNRPGVGINQNQPMAAGEVQSSHIFNGAQNFGSFQPSSQPIVYQGSPSMPGNSQSSFPQQMSFAVMPFSPMRQGRMSGNSMMGSPFGQHQIMSMIGSPMMHQSNSGDEQVFKAFGGHRGASQEGRRGSFQPRDDDEDDNDNSIEGRGQSHGRHMPRPDQEDDEGFNRPSSGGRRPDDSEGPSFGPGQGRRPHPRPPMPRPYRDDDDDDSEGPSFGPSHGRRPHPRPPMPRRDQDDDNEDFSPSREGRPRRERGSDNEGRSKMGNDDEEDEQEDSLSHGRRPGPSGHGGRGHKKPKCKDVVRFLLERLREKKHHGGGRPGRGGRGHGGRGSQGSDESFEGAQLQGPMQGGRFGMGGNEDDSDSGDMIFPRRMPFDFEGDDE